MKFIAVLLFFNFALTSVLGAQTIEFNPVHEYRNRKNTVITCGTLTRLTKTELSIKDGNGITTNVKINSLSGSDKAFVRSIRANRQIFEKRKTAAQKLAERLTETKSNTLAIKLLEELKALGLAASEEAPAVSKFAITIEDDAVAFQSLIVYVAICPTDKTSYARIFRILSTRPSLKSLIRQSPEAFLPTLHRFESLSLQLLIQAAFTGLLHIDDSSFQLKSEPIKFPTTNSNRNNVRAWAMRSLSRIRINAANEAVLKTVKVAGQSINGSKDLQTIHQTILGLTDANRSPTLFKDLLSYKNSFPNQIKTWEHSYNANQKSYSEKKRLIRSSQMRNFYDRNQQFIVRGKVDSFVDQDVIFIDSYGMYHTINKSKLSHTDLKWLAKSLSDEK